MEKAWSGQNTKKSDKNFWADEKKNVQIGPRDK
jgi:hypothetical protein